MQTVLRPSPWPIVPPVECAVRRHLFMPLSIPLHSEPSLGLATERRQRSCRFVLRFAKQNKTREKRLFLVLFLFHCSTSLLKGPIFSFHSKRPFIKERLQVSTLSELQIK